jgi:hypothetical protein
MSVHDAAMFHGFHDAVEQDPEHARAAVRYLAKMRAGTFGFAPYIGQNAYGDNIYDAFAFASVHTWLCQGKVCAVRISVGAKPVADRETEEQNRRLLGVHPPFRAEFWGGVGDDDGELAWDEPITVTRWPFTTCPERCDIKQRPGQAPLEVGTTKASRTALHLWVQGAVARWPYGSNEIVLFISPTGPLQHEWL